MFVPGRTASQKKKPMLPHVYAKDNYTLFCQPCDQENIPVRKPAFGYCVDCNEYLCQSCYTFHRRPKPSRHHQLLDEKHMPQQQQGRPTSSNSSTAGQGQDSLTKPCSKHTKELIKFYCHDHNALICSVCKTLEHTVKSCHVDYIPDISVKSLNSTEFNETLEDLDRVADKCNTITKDRLQRAESTDLTAEIESFRHDINKRLDELEEEAKYIAAAIQEANNKKVKTIEKTCGDINKSLQARADTLKHLNTTEKADQLFTELKLAQQLISESEVLTSQLQSAEDLDEYVFEPNQAIQAILQKEASLGLLKRKNQVQSVNQTNQAEEAILHKEPTLGLLEHKNPTQSVSPEHKTWEAIKLSTPRNIDITTSLEKRDCFITGIAVSPQNQIILTDYNNQFIKMIDNESGEITHTKLIASPWDITIISRDMLAVTLPNMEIIQFVCFASKKLSLKTRWKVDGLCFGISHHQEKLAVTFTSPAKLLIMDLKGTVQGEVIKDSSGGDIFSSPKHTIANSQSIFVTDCIKNAVIWFNWQGEMIGTYDGLEEPSGITMLEDGSLVVSEYNGNRILRVSGDLIDGETILEDIVNPHAVCWCSETRMLYVSRYRTGSKDKNNHILLYETIQNT